MGMGGSTTVFIVCISIAYNAKQKAFSYNKLFHIALHLHNNIVYVGKGNIFSMNNDYLFTITTIKSI